MVKITHRVDAFSDLEFFELEASPVKGQSLQQKEMKKRKRKGQKKLKRIKKPKDVGHFLVQKLTDKILISVHAQTKTS